MIARDSGYYPPAVATGHVGAGWDWSLIARGVVSRTRVGYIEIATNDRVRSCPWGTGEEERSSASTRRRTNPPPDVETGGVSDALGQRRYKGRFEGIVWEKD
jgi:hypothetical protein